MTQRYGRIFHRSAELQFTPVHTARQFLPIRRLGGLRQLRRVRAPLQKREQAPALPTLARAASPSAACHAKRLDCASLLALASITRGWLANRYDASRSDA
ncbi:MAG: hypothetical protein E6L09_08245 [Verrucomicrobia bacterium]|nr:MAG: hypothetical protein E6L09_08245 [Verrucomicrobiota bacterium]